MSHDAVICGFASSKALRSDPSSTGDDQFRPSVFIYGGHGLDGRSRGYVAAPCNNREGVKKWCAQTKRPASSPGSRATQTAGPKAQGTSRMVNVWQHDERRCTRALRLEGRRTSCHSFVRPLSLLPGSRSRCTSTANEATGLLPRARVVLRHRVRGSRQLIVAQSADDILDRVVDPGVRDVIAMRHVG